MSGVAVALLWVAVPLLLGLRRPKDRPGAGVPKDSAIVKLLDGVRRSSSLVSDVARDVGDDDSDSLLGAV